MKRLEQEPVIRLAEAIDGGDAVDWQKESSEQPALRQTLESLRVVESILQGYRSLARTLPGGGGASVPRRSAPRGATSSDAPRTPQATALFHWGPLAALEKIGEGSFGEVYRAHDPALDREVALKLWRTAKAEAATTERVLLEAKRLARVRHPNVLVVHGVDLHGGRAGMWTDLIRGESLEVILGRQGPFGAREAAAIGIELCSALAAVHAVGLVHRDVKTTNVMRERGGRIVLMDFGAVGEVTPFGAVRVEDGAVGTPLTLAPEQLEGEQATRASDLYSLGVLLYRLLAGAYPIEASSLGELRACHRHGRRVALRDRRPDLPAGLVHAVERALEPRATRYAGAGAMERALVEAGARSPTRSRRRRNAASATAATTELPETWTQFRGPAETVDACLRALDEDRALAIAGPAGTGKTRLALHIAEQFRSTCTGGVRFVDLTGAIDAERVPGALAAAFGVAAEPGRAPLAALVERLRGSRALLVVDGCDRVLEAVAQAGTELLRCEGLLWITTSRQAAGVPGERLQVLEALHPTPPEERTASRAHAGTPRVPFVGREREVTAIEQAIGAALRRDGRMVLLTGEAGVGKSRLMEEVRALAESRGLLCLSGRCSYRSGRNFEPFVEALEEFAARFTSGRAVEATATAHARSALFSTVDRLLDPAGVRVEPRIREQIWHAIDDLLERLSRYETVALFLDDLHWADEGTLSLLHHLGRHLGDGRILICGAYRPEEAAAGGGVVEDALLLLASSQGMVRVPLAPLDAGQSAALIGRMVSDASLSERIAPTIHQRAQGNPFFTIEIVRDLASAGSLTAPEDLVLPQTVTDVVIRRLARLRAEERDAIDLAAVEGERFQADTLEAGTGRPRLELLKTLRVLEQTHHLVAATEDGHRFSHGLIREVLLAALPGPLRREYHGIVATHWMSRYGDRPDQASRIADQLFEAHRFAEAWPCFLRAATEARRLFLHDRALEFLERGLTAFDRAGADAGGRGDLLRARYEVLLLLGRPDRARAAAEEALEHETRLSRGAEAAAAWEALGECALALGDLDAAERSLDLARRFYAAASDLAPVARCDQKLGAAATRRGDFERAVLRLSTALECMESQGDALGAARVRIDVGDVLYRRGDFDRALATFEQAVGALRRMNERPDLSRGLNRLGNALFQSGRTEPAMARYHEALALATELGDFHSMARLEANLGNVHLVQGEPERALESYQHALESFEEIGDRTGAGLALMALGNACFTRGQFADAVDHYRSSIELRTPIGDRPGLANALENMGVAEFNLGQFGTALEHLRAALRLHLELGDRPGRAESLLNLGTVMAVLGDLDAAAQSYAEADLVAADLGDPRRKARVGLAQACLRLWEGDRAGAESWLAVVAALEVEEPVVQARRYLIEALLDTAPGDSGDGIFSRALETARRSGSLTEQATVRLALTQRMMNLGRIEDAGTELDWAFELVEAAPVPLLEIHACRLRRTWLDRTGAGQAEMAAIDRRIESLVSELQSAQPLEGPRARDFREPLFPLP